VKAANRTRPAVAARGGARGRGTPRPKKDAVLEASKRLTALAEQLGGLDPLDVEPAHVYHAEDDGA
jgi:hypothetical protein